MPALMFVWLKTIEMECRLKIMAATAIERSPRPTENLTNSVSNTNDGGSESSGNSNSPTTYVKSGKPSSRLRQSQSTSCLQVRARSHSAGGCPNFTEPPRSAYDSRLTVDAFNMYGPNPSFQTLASSTSVYGAPQNPSTTPRFSLYSAPGSASGHHHHQSSTNVVGGTSSIPPPPPPPPSISSSGIPIAHNPILHTLQKHISI
ncbi:hypothetical protein L596_030575 [Steinernema carpocapsae]|uniref:Uncharacterized protein n=1 Tax=Steinernema carpocapsae TaxID=34508 RepID=A0A4U5LPS8_STECR|nr:hypothetical protein L596_030575 [Steinernema carpocapsae]